jgi:hypothetical protein
MSRTSIAKVMLTSYPAGIEAIEQEQANARRRDERYKQAQLVLDGKLVRYTFFLFLVGAVGGCIAIWQTVIAHRSATAAKASADVALSAARAWVGPVNIEARP